MIRLFTLDATHNGRGHVTFALGLRERSFVDDWELSMSFQPEAGEQMVDVADALETLITGAGDA